MTASQTPIMRSGRASAAGGLAMLSGLFYVAAVVIALPLGVPGIVDEKYCAIPLAIANVMLAFAMIASKGE